MKEIQEIFKSYNIAAEHIIPYGRNIAKLDTEALDLSRHKKGHLVLVTAMSPTPKGEGKTTTTIGLGDALRRLGKKSLVCLRQPSMGPCFGVKGGATGGGKAMLTPMESINLNFTGDFHAIGAAHNLLSAMIDNHIHFGNELNIDPRRITWRRVIDMNDRNLRSITQGLGGPANGYPREDGFDITVASEVMAVFCLASDLQDLQEKLGNIIIGITHDKKTITARDLKANGAMAAILKNAILPNLVQTLEGNAALVHGGPFANIAHGCNSVIATSAALKLADYVVTEAGFGADLGAEKFLNIKCRKANIWPSCAVLVATIRGIKHHGTDLQTGIVNINRHVENLKKFNLPITIAINRFTEDTEEELNWVINYCEKQLGVRCVVNSSWAQGSVGSEELAKEVVRLCDLNILKPSFSYENKISLADKIKTIAQKIYHAENIQFSESAAKKITEIESLGFQDLPICMAKTQYSFSSDPKKLGAPSFHTLDIKEVRLAAGAGFVVVICGEIMTMPGLPRSPAANEIYVDQNGQIQGLF
jgi:formate--tetrahydrofolate ligase